jgi:high affinity Mn2+ porin
MRSPTCLALALCGLLLIRPSCAQIEQAACEAGTPCDGARANDAAAGWSLHGQFTNVTQWHPAFASSYRGANSLDAANGSNETADLTAFIGRRLWEGAGLYLNPEIDQGYGLSSTLGVAGFPSGEAYKLGRLHPYFRLPRAFLRQTLATGDGGQDNELPEGPNQLAESLPEDNLVLTAGKFSVVDVFDADRYAHDPRGDFMNWSIIESGAFDYAADAWGFTYGGAAEWTHAWWTLRAGFFALSKVPNTKDIDGQFKQFSWVAELEERHRLLGHDGKLKLLGFDNRGRMGNYDDAVALGRVLEQAPEMAPVRRFASRAGVALNLEQELRSDLGAFARLSFNDGSKEAFDFTEIDKSLAAGIALQGEGWNRTEDTVGLAAAINGISSAAQSYFAAGGLGILIGDGALTYGYERIVETYYSWRAAPHFTLTGDYQLVIDPAYNRDRGPVSILGLRLHLEL